LAGAALSLIFSQREEDCNILERYFARYPHNTVGDTLRDTWTIG